MPQTESTKLALARDGFLCQWHLNVLHRVRHIFDDYVYGYPPEMAGGHHCLKRRLVDTPETIMALCSECHWKVENAKIPKSEMIALMSKISGVDLYRKYPGFMKFTDAEYYRAVERVANA